MRTRLVLFPAPYTSAACLALGTQYPRLERHLGRLGVARFASISYVFAFPLLPILHHVRKAEISRHTDLPVERGYPVGPWTAAFSIFTVVPIILGSYQWACSSVPSFIRSDVV